MEKMQLKNVRLSFPNVFRKASFNGEETKYEATFLVPKSDTKTKEMIDQKIQMLLEEHKIKVPRDKYAIKDGDGSNYDGYENHWSIKASSKKRPLVLDRNREILNEDDDKIYAGCYVNAIVDFWVQNNPYGKRVNCNLYGIQFVEDGEPLGNFVPSTPDDFDDLSDDGLGDD